LSPLMYPPHGAVAPDDAVVGEVRRAPGERGLPGLSHRRHVLGVDHGEEGFAPTVECPRLEPEDPGRPRGPVHRAAGEFLRHPVSDLGHGLGLLENGRAVAQLPGHELRGATPLLALLEEPPAVDDDRALVGEERHEIDLVLGEYPPRGEEESQHTEHEIAEAEWEHRGGVDATLSNIDFPDQVRILLDVLEVPGHSTLERSADDALAVCP